MFVLAASELKTQTGAVKRLTCVFALPLPIEPRAGHGDAEARARLGVADAQGELGGATQASKRQLLLLQQEGSQLIDSYASQSTGRQQTSSAASAPTDSAGRLLKTLADYSGARLGSLTWRSGSAALAALV